MARKPILEWLRFVRIGFLSLIRFILVKFEALFQKSQIESEPCFQSELIRNNPRSDCSRLKTWLAYIELNRIESDCFLADLHQTRFRTFFGLVRNDSQWFRNKFWNLN